MAPGPQAKLFDRHQIELLGSSATTNQADDENDGDDEDAFRLRYDYYKSEKILGRLYRNVDEKRIWDESIRRAAVNQRGPSVWEQFAGLMRRKIETYTDGGLDWRARQEEAWNIRAGYEDAVLNATYQYSDNSMKELSEVEVFCGFIFNRSGWQTRRQKDNSEKLHEEFGRMSDKLVASMRRRNTKPRNETSKDDGQPAVSADDDASASSRQQTRSNARHVNDPTNRALAFNRDALELSYACFMVGLRENDDADFKHQTPLVSFKVIAASVLTKELTEWANRVRGGQIAQGLATGQTVTVGGGFVGVNSGGAQFPQYGENPWDVGQLPNWGFSNYI